MRVVDLTATLSRADIAGLDQLLGGFEDRKGSQIAVLVVPTTQPETIEQFSIRVADQWKLGRKKTDDGAILVVAKNDRTLRIEVGYGLEGALNDAISKRIIDEYIVPRFKRGDFAGGIVDGVNVIMQVVDGEPLPPPARSIAGEQQDSLRQVLPLAFFAAVFVGGALRAIVGRVPGAILAGAILAAGTWFVFGAAAMSIVAGMVGLVVTLAGGRMGVGGWYGGYSGHGRGGSGLGGGGFRGGGGGFGGGGASGRW